MRIPMSTHNISFHDKQEDFPKISSNTVDSRYLDPAYLE